MFEAADSTGIEPDTHSCLGSRLTAESDREPATELPPHGNRMSWHYDIWGSHPKWVLEPSILRIKEAIGPHLQQQLRPCFPSSCLTPALQDFELEYLAEGAFNKTYTATIAPNTGHAQSYIVRISLPVDAHHKTASEVATIQYLRAQTTIPIPQVFAWDANEENPIGFEWILMEKVAGLPLQEVWYPENRAGSVDWQVKQRVVDGIADSVAQLWRLRFSAGGSLYLANVDSLSTSVTVGRIVSMDFFWENHLQLLDVERGPFHTSWPWLQARLQFVISDAEKILQKGNQTQGMDGVPPNEDDLEQAAFMKESAERLFHQLPNFFPISQNLDNTPSESFTLSHSDLSAHNILVDPSGALVGIVDWECTNALPTWAACRIPEVLDSLDSETEKPKVELYADGHQSRLYLDDLEAYEQTILRGSFVTRMKELEPSWIMEFESQEGNRKRDFETAVKWVADVSGFHNRTLQKWLDMLEAQGGSNPQEYCSLQSKDY